MSLWNFLGTALDSLVVDLSGLLSSPPGPGEGLVPFGAMRLFFIVESNYFEG